MIPRGTIYINISAMCDRGVNGLLLPLPNKRQQVRSGLVTNKPLKKEAFTDGKRKVVKKVILLSSLPLCIQQAILGDEYGNGPHSCGTISFQRGRSGSAVRFD